MQPEGRWVGAQVQKDQLPAVLAHIHVMRLHDIHDAFAVLDALAVSLQVKRVAACRAPHCLVVFLSSCLCRHNCE